MKKTKGEQFFDLFLYLGILCLILITLYPFWNQLILSFSSGEGVYATGITLWPKNFSYEAYLLAFHYKMLWLGYLNTIIRTALGVFLSLVITSIFAYPLSKIDLPYNKSFTMFILFTMLFNGGLIPNFLLIRNLGLLDTIWALVIPGSVGVFNVLIIRNFFRSLPESLEDSAKVDGAGYFTIFSRIVIPLSKPVLVTVALWVGVYHWNSWFDAMIYVKSPEKQVLQIILRKIILENNMDSMHALMLKRGSENRFSGRELQATMVMLSIIPMLVVYPYVQNFFVKGIMLGAVKG